MVSHPHCPPPYLHQKHDSTSNPGCSYGSRKKSQEAKPHKSPHGGTLSMQIQREKVDQWAEGGTGMSRWQFWRWVATAV